MGAAVLAVGISITSCSHQGNDDGVPVLPGANATLVAQADCGADGVANVQIVYGQVSDHFLIGRNALTQTLGGGMATFDRRYGVSPGDENLLFTITTSPTTGTCTSTLTDADGGDVIAEKKSAGKVELKVMFSGK